MSRTFAKKYSRAAIFSYLFSYLLVFCATLLVVSMTIIPRVRGSLALSCFFAKQPLLLPIWESECRSSCLIQVFIFIASLYPTSTTWVLQVATSSLLGTGCHFLPAQLFKCENNVFLIFWTVYCSIYISKSYNVIIILVFSSHSLPFSFIPPLVTHSNFWSAQQQSFDILSLYISLLSLSIQSGTCTSELSIWSTLNPATTSLPFLCIFSFFFPFSWLLPSNFPCAASFHSYLLASFPPTTPSFLSWIHLSVI